MCRLPSLPIFPAYVKVVISAGAGSWRNCLGEEADGNSPRSNAREGKDEDADENADEDAIDKGREGGRGDPPSNAYAQIYREWTYLFS